MLERTSGLQLGSSLSALHRRLRPFLHLHLLLLLGHRRRRPPAPAAAAAAAAAVLVLVLVLLVFVWGSSNDGGRRQANNQGGRTISRE